MVESNAAPTPATRMINTNAPSPVAASAGAGGKSPGTVGKATVERMISHNVSEAKKAQGKKFGIIGAVAVAELILFGAVIGGAYWYSSSRENAIKTEMSDKQADLEKKLADGKGLSAAEINDKYAKSVVYIEVAWRLIDTAKQAQMYHQYIPNNRAALKILYGVDYGAGPIDPSGPAMIPVYTPTQNSYEPILTTKSDNSVPIGGMHRGTGFVVTARNFSQANDFNGKC